MTDWLLSQNSTTTDAPFYTSHQDYNDRKQYDSPSLFTKKLFVFSHRKQNTFTYNFFIQLFYQRFAFSKARWKIMNKIKHNYCNDTLMWPDCSMWRWYRLDSGGSGKRTLLVLEEEHSHGQTVPCWVDKDSTVVGLVTEHLTAESPVQLDSSSLYRMQPSLYLAALLATFYTTHSATYKLYKLLSNILHCYLLTYLLSYKYHGVFLESWLHDFTDAEQLMSRCINDTSTCQQLSLLTSQSLMSCCINDTSTCQQLSLLTSQSLMSRCINDTSTCQQLSLLTSQALMSCCINGGVNCHYVSILNVTVATTFVIFEKCKKWNMQKFSQCTYVNQDRNTWEVKFLMAKYLSVMSPASVIGAS